MARFANPWASACRLAWPVLLSALVAACQATAPDSGDGSQIGLETECQSPRPEVCTQEYRPVCGLRDTGVRCVTTPCPATEWRTYGNACRACSDPDVMGYREGACGELVDLNSGAKKSLSRQ